MTSTHSATWLWVPRIAGVAVALFLAVFALDAFTGQPFLEAVLAFLVHLVPSFIVLIAVALAWRWPLAGAVAFPALAIVYATMVHWRLDWVAAIGSPLVIVGGLFFLSWRVAGRA
jgi:hypothetical protein